MAAGTWKIYAAAKKKIGTGGNAMTAGGITLGVGVFKMSLHKTSASANIKVLSTRSTFASIGSEISARGGYVAGGRNLVPATGRWSAKNSAKQLVFYYSTIGLVFTASNSSLINIRYAVIRTSVSATGGKLLCFCTLTATQFTVTSPNTLTITPDATNGVFTLV
jgi:hypothetical protein